MFILSAPAIEMSVRELFLTPNQHIDTQLVPIEIFQIRISNSNKSRSALNSKESSVLGIAKSYTLTIHFISMDICVFSTYAVN